MKKKGHQKVVFKPYDMNQLSLPMSLESMIPPQHKVRAVNQVIDEIGIDPLLAKYKGGGAGSYHPKMMLKVLVYGYGRKVWSSRQLARALRENIHFMWLAGGNTPNRFRSDMKTIIDEVFQLLVEYMAAEGLINLEEYYLDGTKIEANANRYSFVWKKSVDKNQKKLREKVKGLLEEIDRANELEDELYGDQDLPEMGENVVNNPEAVADLVGRINEALSKKGKNDKSVKITRKAARTLVKDCLPRAMKYKVQLAAIGNERNSMSKTDPEATFMRMKEDHMKNGQLKPAYNVQTGTQNQFVVGFSIHQKATDTSCLKVHLEGIKKAWGSVPQKIIADAGYGSEENYEYLKEQEIQNFVKYNKFHYEQKRHVKTNPFLRENMVYDAENDQYICYEHKKLKYIKTVKRKSTTGYESHVRVDECEDCTGCTNRESCTKSKYWNRRIEVNVRLEELKQEARENLTSELGLALRKRRCIEPEYVFGRIKWCWGFKRFLLRGLEKVKIEWGLLCMAHNISKMATIQWA
ncbi:IS1182 family transposase [Phosphitispora sp. TUW77]|uniref:IS1182 family transposase n=1 Tax=Phosphitispora sp. TUW77 TaxID=3152361 RepID=UPI003AB53F47